MLRRRGAPLVGCPTKTIQYRYDSRGNRSASIDQDGGRFTYSYDSVNRIKQVQNPQGDRTAYGYAGGICWNNVCA